MAAALALLAAATSCSPGAAGAGAAGAGSGAAASSPTASAALAPVSAEINQLRDNYSKQIIAIQLTNNTPDPLTVLGAELGSALFAATISWQPPAGGIELPPGQAKILPAQLPAADCGTNTAPSPEAATVTLRFAGAPGTASAAAVPATTVHAADPYGVLSRNNAEMCLAAEAAAVAAIRLAPELEVSPDARTAVVRLIIAPRRTPGAVNPDSAGTLTIDRIDGTTLLAEDRAAPWPRSVTVNTRGPGEELRLGIRPARCDPHAVAEDKVGTLLPLRVHTAGRAGVLKIDAGPLLRGRIYDFVTTACGRQ
jgi:hypothetical protein